MIKIEETIEWFLSFVPTNANCFLMIYFRQEIYFEIAPHNIECRLKDYF